MLEPASAFIEPIQTRALASHPEITTCILENAIDFIALAETVRAGNIVGDAAALAIESIKGAGDEPTHRTPSESSWIALTLPGERLSGSSGRWV